MVVRSSHYYIRIYSKHILVCKRKALLLYKHYMEQIDAVCLKYSVCDASGVVLESTERHFRVGKDTFSLLNWLTLAIFSETKKRQMYKEAYNEACSYFTSKSEDYENSNIITYLNNDAVNIRWSLDAVIKREKCLNSPVKKYENYRYKIPFDVALDQSYNTVFRRSTTRTVSYVN